MLSTILVPLDGSSLAERALPVAARVATAASADLLLARVVGPFSLPPTPTEASVSQTAQEYLDQIAARLRDQEHTVRTIVLNGDAPAQILGAIRTQAVTLVVMSTHGRSGIGRWLYGSVADAVMRSATVPLMLVPPGLSREWAADRRTRILVPLDGSRQSEAVLGPVVNLARQLGAELTLLSVVFWPPILYSDPLETLPYPPEDDLQAMQAYLDGIAAKVRERGVVVRCLVDAGPTPAAIIARVALAENADFVAMSTHGRGGLARVVLGSTTTGTLQQVGVPVLVVRPTQLQAAASLVAESPAPLAQV
jgi:nucleotide-binding universal stress UspA family protein